MRAERMRLAAISLGLWALVGLLYAGEGDAPKDKTPKGATPPAAEEIAGKVDDTVITRGDVDRARRLVALVNPQAVTNSMQILEQLINRTLWQRYFDKNSLRPSDADLQQAIDQLDAELTRRGSSYRAFLNAQGLQIEEHAALLSYELSMRRVIDSLQAKLTTEELEAEFNAHPQWYDGSRIRVSQIFVDTSNLAYDRRELDKAKERIDQIQAQLIAGRDFEQLARDYSQGASSGMGGDRGWFVRKGADVDETLMAAAWDLKVGEFTKPIRGANGWHILKVTAREPAYFTFHGARQNIVNALVRRRLEAMLEEFRKAAKIEIRL